MRLIAPTALASIIVISASAIAQEVPKRADFDSYESYAKAYQEFINADGSVDRGEKRKQEQQRARGEKCVGIDSVTVGLSETLLVRCFDVERVGSTNSSYGSTVSYKSGNSYYYIKDAAVAYISNF